MKKISLLLCTIALLGTMTSCHRSTDESPNVSPVVVDETRTLVVTTNTPATITYEGKTVSSVTTATFEKVAAQGKLKITPVSSDYYDQEEMTIDFYDQLTLLVDVQLVKKPTIEVSQEDAKSGVEVTNDDQNKQDTDTDASMTVPSTTDITGNTTDPFSITTFVPAETVLESTEDGQEVEANVLVVRCTPDGASFSEPVTVNLAIANSSGFDIDCVSEDGGESLPMTDLGNDKWQVSIPHFSDWFNYLRAVVVETNEGEEVVTGTSAIVSGNNSISYRVKAGAVETTSLQCVLVTTFLKKKFGAYFQTTKNATFTSDAAGTAFWRVTQPYKDVTLRSNIMVFTARVYGEPVFEITATQSGQGGHSGGSVN